MTEINKNQNSVYFKGNIVNPKIISEKELSEDNKMAHDIEREIDFDDLNKAPGAIYGKSVVHKCKNCESPCEECVRQSVEKFAQDPEICELAMMMCDKFLKSGMNMEDALDNTAYMMGAMHKALSE